MNNRTDPLISVIVPVYNVAPLLMCDKEVVEV